MASFTAIISLLLFTLFLTVPISSYPIDSICKQSKYPIFCFNLLNPRANENLQELDQFVIDSTTASAAKTSSKIQSLLPQTSDPNLKVVYSLCANYYSAALSALAAAKAQLKSRDFRGVKAAADIVSEDAVSCRQTFAMAPSQRIAIASDNNEFELFSSVFLAVSGKL